MRKDFEDWNKQKEVIHCEWTRKFYHEREIWWSSLGVNIGFEQDGKGVEYQRPVLILKGLSKSTCLIVPLTSSMKSHPLRIYVGSVGEKEASVIISQIRTIDTKRLVGRITYLDKDRFEIIRKAVKNMF
jgi:mRNA interferase MazF